MPRGISRLMRKAYSCVNNDVHRITREQQDEHKGNAQLPITYAQLLV